MSREFFGPMSALAVALLGACGGTTTHSSPDAPLVAGASGASRTDGGSVATGGGSNGGAGGAGYFPPPRVACRSDVPSPEEIEATPRALPNLEQLALKLSDGIVAQQAVYERVVRDVTSIRQQVPEIADIEYFPPNDGRGLELNADDPTFAAMRANIDGGGPWGCLGATYWLMGYTFSEGSRPNIGLILRGIYDMQRVAAQYAEIPGILSAEPEVAGGDGSTICLTQEGDTWHYVFDRASGDCPAGCIDHAFTHFSTDSSGKVSSLGTPTPAEQAVYASAEACR